MSFWHFAAEALFVSAGIVAVWSIIHTIREAWPRIKELLRELDQ
jgi:hypothetical protein